MTDRASTLGFRVVVGPASCLAIEDDIGCDARILAGEAWITAEGAPEDIIAGAGATVPFERGNRFNVSAFRGLTAVLFIVPRHRYDAGFRLTRRDGLRVLSVR